MTKIEEVNRIATVPNGTAKKDDRTTKEEIRIAPLKQSILTAPIVGSTPLKVLRFSKKKQDQVMATQQAGSQSGSKKKRDPKDFEKEYEESKYFTTKKIAGKKQVFLGINASGVRNGLIETCRVAGFVMTKAKMSIFCEADGFDDLDGTPLVFVIGEPKMSVDPVRNASGVMDLRPRCCFDDWKINLRLRFDEDQFSPSDVLNLLIRVGQQNGLGEGRPNGSNGNGTGNGVFTVDVDSCTLQRLSSVPATYRVKEV